jgi:Tfp pilus assembly protein FimT
MELTMVLFIVGLTMGLVLPGMDRIFGGDPLRITMNRVLSGVDQARTQAMLHRKAWTLVLDLAGSSEEGALLDRDKQTLVLNPEGGTRVRDVVFVRTGQVVQEEQALLVFLPNGLTEPALIHCVSEDGRIQTIYLKSFNPRPTVIAGDQGMDDLFRNQG